jgi:acetyl esterase/lipase
MISDGARRFHERCVQFGANAETALKSMTMLEYAGSLYKSLGSRVGYKSETVNVRGVDARWVTPEQDVGSTVLFFTHGGGYISGSSETHAQFAAHLATRLGARALLPDYGLVPEATFPAQIEDCLGVYEWLLNQGTSPKRIVFAGESAGGALVVTTQLLAKERGLPIPVAGFAMSPWVDIECKGESHRSNIGKDLLVGDGEASAANFKAYRGGYSASNPLVNPLYADLSGLAPLLAQVGGDEMLRDDSVLLVQRAKGQGAVAELDVVPGMQHLFQMCAGEMPEADAALDRGIEFIKRFLPEGEFVERRTATA